METDDNKSSHGETDDNQIVNGESFLLPSSRPVAMVLPERDSPGITAHAWAMPMTIRQAAARLMTTPASRMRMKTMTGTMTMMMTRTGRTPKRSKRRMVSTSPCSGRI